MVLHLYFQQRQLLEVFMAFVNRINCNFSDHPKYPCISIFFQGCDKKDITGYFCPQCHNPDTWEPSCMFSISYENIFKIVAAKINTLLLAYNYCAVSLVGGEPLHITNREDVLKLTKLLKETYGSKVVILLYSWRTEKDIEAQNLEEYLSYIDELCLGEYLESKHVDGFPASSNQKYIKNKYSIIFS